MQIVGIFLLCVSGAIALCPAPDGTDTELYFSSCASGEPLIVNSVHVQNTAGLPGFPNPNYPIYLLSPLNVQLNVTNTASIGLSNPKMFASVARYTDSVGFCSWAPVYSGTLLDNINACEFFFGAPTCSIPTGTNLLPSQISMTPFYPLINTLSASEVHRLRISLRVAGLEIACMNFEAKIINY